MNHKTRLHEIWVGGRLMQSRNCTPQEAKRIAQVLGGTVRPAGDKARRRMTKRLRRRVGGNHPRTEVKRQAKGGG